MKTERFYTVPLGEAFEYPRYKRTPAAVKMVRTFVTKHMKAQGMKVSISDSLNKFLWQRSIQKPPRRVKVRVVKEDSLVNVFLADEKEVAKETSAKETKVAPKETKVKETKEEKVVPATATKVSESKPKSEPKAETKKEAPAKAVKTSSK